MSKSDSLPVVDIERAPVIKGSPGYPEGLRQNVAGRTRRELGKAAGLTRFGVNHTTLEPAQWSSIRNWHTHEDEFIYVVEGELTLVTDRGEQTLTAGISAGFPAGKRNGHHLINRSEKPARYLEMGNRDDQDEVYYPDADLVAKRVNGHRVNFHRDGRPY